MPTVLITFWPPRAINDCFWWTATTSGNAFFLDAFRWKFVMSGLAYGLIAYPVLRLFHAPTLFLYGTINGLAYDPINGLGPDLKKYIFVQVSPQAAVYELRKKDGLGAYQKADEWKWLEDVGVTTAGVNTNRNCDVVLLIVKQHMLTSASLATPPPH